MKFVCVASHTPENCGVNDPKLKDMTEEEKQAKRVEWKKYVLDNGISVLGMYSAGLEHTHYYVLETDSLEKLQGLFREVKGQNVIRVVPVVDHLADFNAVEV